MAASAVHSAQTRLELQNRADQLVGLQLFAKSLSGQDSLERLLNTVVRNVADLLRAEHAFLLLLRDRLPQRFECLPITHGAYHPWLVCA
ncbi:MAG: hypothetical protein IPK16_17040 [Anaerolineales bacterium]|nr:hypothetical protein [Anaerolineales bacterium]